MARLFGFVGNRADLGARVLELESKPLKVVAKGTTLGWGIGFYQAGEVLLRRRPIDERAEIDVASLAKDLRADVLIGHVRAATVGNLRTENTHPFRYRQWLFAHTGTVDGYGRLRDRVSESLPEFLRRNVRGDTDSELLFHLFLSFLHDAGQLGGGHVDPEATRAALRATLSLIDRLRAEDGGSNHDMNMLVTDGEHMVAMHHSATMGYRVIKGAPISSACSVTMHCDGSASPTWRRVASASLPPTSTRSRVDGRWRRPMRWSRSPARMIRRSNSADLTALALLATCSSSAPRGPTFATLTELPQEPRRPDGVVVDPS
jgi:glutamine amidotransferase